MRALKTHALSLVSSLCWLGALAVFLRKFVVDIPFWDEWVLAAPLVEISRGHIPLASFWKQHGEQRCLFTKPIAAYSSYVSHWSIPFNLSVNVFFACVTCVLLLYLSWLRRDDMSRAALLVLQVVIPSAVFSLAQYETWLWTWGEIWLFSVTCVCAAVVSLDRWLRSSDRKWLFIGAGFCVIATFSTANALLCWIATMPIIIEGSPPGRRRLLLPLTWIATFVALGAIYSIGYERGIGIAVFVAKLHDPLYVAHYFLTILGTVLSRVSTVAALIGTIEAIALATLTIVFCRRRSERLPVALPWMCLGLFTILYALSVTVGRIYLGYESASASRYVSTTYLLTLAVLEMSAIAIGPQCTTSRAARAFVAACIVVIALIVAAIPAAAESARDYVVRREIGRASIELEPYIRPRAEGALDLLYPDDAELRAFANEVAAAGIRSFRRSVTFLDGAELGKINPMTRVENQKIRIDGWAVDPAIRSNSGVIFLSEENAATFFAAGMANDQRSTTVTFGGKRVRSCAWTIRFSSRQVKRGKRIIAWLYLRDRSECVRLSGMAILPDEQRDVGAGPLRVQ
jgi:hypothetical protein